MTKTQKTVLAVFGTRPEAIKMCPLVKELRTRSELKTLVAVTGQHREMLDTVLKSFDIVPEYDLDLMRAGQTLGRMNGEMLIRLESLYTAISPDLVLVHGDTATALAASLAAFFSKIPVGHVEAGLRSHRIDDPFPEEMNRQVISLVSTLDFAPTEIAAENLIRIGKPQERIFVTGNTVIDALKTTVSASFTSPILQKSEGMRRILLTCHRRENLGKPIREAFRAALRVVETVSDVCIICPLHKNPLVREAAREVFGENPHPRIFLSEPLDVTECHNVMARCSLILTDSGGIQEEAPALGVPVLLLRRTTERPEGLLEGSTFLCGGGEEEIYQKTVELLCRDRNGKIHLPKRSLYGDGRASKRIADAVVEYLSNLRKETGVS